MAQIQERGSTHVYKVNRISKEEIDSMVSLCVYENPPFCNAACPLKLDTKAMLKAAADDDFKRALQLYEKATPFPVILSAGCEAPCEGRCRLCEIGDAVSVRAVEAAVARYGEKTKSGGVFRMKKKKTTAIFGSGLFCLFLAGEIEKKAYPLTVFCEEADIKSFMSAETGFLSDDERETELQRLREKDIAFEFGCRLNREFFEEKRGSFDVVCASEKAAKTFFPAAACNAALMLYEPEKLIMGAGTGVMDAAFGAKKAALTVDRLAQGLDANNTRGTEGAVESRLYTDLSSAKALKRIPIAQCGYSREQAQDEAKRCIQCFCDECFKGCSYLQHYKKHPGLIAKEIYNNTQIIMGDHQLNKPMNACSLCGQCTVTCPNGFDMAHVCHLARQNMVSTDKMPLSPHEFPLMDMMFSNSEAFLSRPQPGYHECRYVFFPGCQASAVAPEMVRAAYEDLCARLEGGVALMLGCCGAICDWAGRFEMYDGVRKFIDSELAKLGDPQVIVGCPTCGRELSGHKGLKIAGIWEILDEIGLPEGAKGLDRPVALHDSCGARGDKDTQIAVRSLAKKLGCELVETEYSGDKSPCCGYGGLTAYANREVAKEMTEKCLSRSDAPYITYCMACRDRFAREGRESKHILELIYGTDAGPSPDLSQRRYNRLALRQQLLRELWDEEVSDVQSDINIAYTDEALKMMDEHMILKSDIESVVEYVNRTGEEILDLDSELFSARRRIGNVTFWIMYEREDDKFIIRRAYSHRMNVVRRQG